MSELKHMAIAFSIVGPVLAILAILFRRRWLKFYEKHSYLEQKALQVMVVWVLVLLLMGIFYWSTGMHVIPALTYFFTLSGGLILVRIQYQFKNDGLEQHSNHKSLVFDERDYRIGQEALQAAYHTFWILFWIVGAVLYFAGVSMRLEIPAWAVMLVLPAMASIVSLVHAITILRLYRVDADSETVDG